MKTFFSTTRQIQARWLLMFGVLAGLFFSSGEGIRLLPFPFKDAHSPKIAGAVAGEHSKSYALTVFNSRSAAALLKIKLQKDAPPFLAGGDRALDRPETPAAAPRGAAPDFYDPNPSRFSRRAGSRSNRAPPSI